MSQRSPGEVRDAILAHLRKAGTSRVTDIHAAVEKKLGGSVAPSSVRSYLRLNANGTLERVGRGKYRLRGK